MDSELKSIQPTISVIVPVYKVEQYLPACINSILAQTYTDFELILVDDGSPDSCGAICDSYAARDPRIRVIHQENMGLSGARNSGMDTARGEFITFVDSDDVVLPLYLEFLLRAAIDGNTDLSVCRLREFSDSNEREAVAQHAKKSFFSSVMTGKDACLAQYEGSSLVTVFACGKLFRTSLIGGMRFPEGRLHEDQAFTPLIYDKAEKVAVLDIPVYRNRTRNDSITREQFSLKRYDDIWAIDKCIAFFQEKNEPEIVQAAQSKRKRILAIYSIYARRDGIEVPEQYRIGLLSALAYLRKHVRPMKFEYYLAQVSPRLVKLFEYEMKLMRMFER